MNLRDGRIGRQESVAMGLIALCAAGLVTVNPQQTYAGGNLMYLARPLGVGLALAAFWITGLIQRRSGAKDLFELLELSLGPVLGALAALLLCACLLLCAALPLFRVIGVMQQAIFPKVERETLALYCVIPVFMMSWKGLECISRTSLCFVWLLGLAMLVQVAAGYLGYASYRLYPLAGADGIALSTAAWEGAGLFLPGLMAFLLLSQGMQGSGNAQRYGLWSGVLAAGALLILYLALGLTFDYRQLAQLNAPFYRMGTALQFGAYELRMDKVLFFIWVCGGMTASSLFCYAAAFSYAKAFRQQDIRPAAATMALAATAVLLADKGEMLFQALLPLLTPVLGASLAAVWIMGFLRTRKGRIDA